MGNVISVTVITDPAFQQHDTGGGEHPEIPQRLEVIAKALEKSSLQPLISYARPRAVERSQLLAFHSEDWLFRFEEAVLSGRTYIDHPDNQVGYDSFEIATLSAGTGLVGVDLVEKNPQEVVFGSTRPPGHHAEPNMPFGFCFFNNCVIAARYWQRQYGRERICILDFDAHHGNGIQTAFEEDPHGAYVSLHEHPSFSYPGTGWPEEHGLKEGRGTILNLPLLPGAGDTQVRETFARIVTFLESFQPEALIVGAGFDAHAEDDMSGLAFSTEMYTELGTLVADLARRFTEGRLLSILEGGYHIETLGDCTVAYLEGIVRARQQAAS
ncbi:histone deacetylase family protein [Desulfogranum mediterraneum]|uniref:histone deacetylase family protein n=1 Tax=Desulfogranum mediterraneum TaxID=160661 RepID=UPI00042017E8|nr:histone deacetylase [Desulfogranum mediterraneum]